MSATHAMFTIFLSFCYALKAIHNHEGQIDSNLRGVGPEPSWFRATFWPVYLVVTVLTK